MSKWLFKFVPVGYFSKQASKPSGFIGRYLMTALFNKGNAEINSLVKQSLKLQATDHVLEIGYGPGYLIEQIAQITQQGLICGLDYSPEMYQQASRVNQQAISQGKVRLQIGDSHSLPFDDESFDKVCCVNVIYFWRQPSQNLKEIYRVLKPGGRLAIGFRDKQQMQQLNLDEDIFTSYSLADILTLLADNGFSNAYIEHQHAEPLDSYCAIAYKEKQ